MVGRDSRLAELFFNNNEAQRRDFESTLNSTKCSTNMESSVGLTLENLKLHDRSLHEQNNAFLPKMSRLMQNQQRRTITEFTGKFSIFEALYELEMNNESQTKPT